MRAMLLSKCRYFELEKIHFFHKHLSFMDIVLPMFECGDDYTVSVQFLFVKRA